MSEAGEGLPPIASNLSAELDQVFNALRDHENRLRARAAALNEQEKALRELRGVLENLEKELGQRAEQITEQERRLAAARTELDAASRALTEKQAAVQAEEDRQRAAREELGARFAEVARERDAVKAREEALALRERKLAESREYILSFCAEIAALREELEAERGGPALQPGPEVEVKAATVPAAASPAPTVPEPAGPVDPALLKLRRDVRRRAMGV